MRMNKLSYFLAIAKQVANRSPCSRRKFGAIIVKKGSIVGTGYNGTARGTLNCGMDVPCIKEIANEPANISYDYCPAVHAEQNAIINSNRDDRIGATMYLAPSLGQGDRPCFKCRRHILNAQIKDIYYVNHAGVIVYEIICHDKIPDSQTEDYVDLENAWIYDKLEKANPEWETDFL